jgi:exosome complex RNA-binding protein Rrp42 (RNase PH superfamily)
VICNEKLYEREHLVKTINTHVRYDGRSNEEVRDFEIETNIIQTAEGSARLKWEIQK